jgi:hypothetical protein
MKQRKKSEAELAGRTNISLSPEAQQQGALLMTLRGDRKFSRMLASLIKEDYDRRASFNLKVVRFIDAFGRLFGPEWENSQRTIQSTSAQSFLVPGTYPQWSDHDTMIAAYCDLVKELGDQKLLDAAKRSVWKTPPGPVRQGLG